MCCAVVRYDKCHCSRYCLLGGHGEFTCGAPYATYHSPSRHGYSFISTSAMRHIGSSRTIVSTMKHSISPLLTISKSQAMMKVCRQSKSCLIGGTGAYQVSTVTGSAVVFCSSTSSTSQTCFSQLGNFGKSRENSE